MELKLIKEELEDLKRNRAIGTLTPYGCRYLKELNYIVEQLSLQPVSESYIMNWIKTEDQKPEIGKKIICYSKIYSGDALFIGYYSDKGFRDIEFGEKSKYSIVEEPVTHWFYYELPNCG